jgi:hypothetical protein
MLFMLYRGLNAFSYLTWTLNSLLIEEVKHSPNDMGSSLRMTTHLDWCASRLGQLASSLASAKNNVAGGTKILLIAEQKLRELRAFQSG